MEPSAILITASAAAAFGAGTGLGIKLAPAFLQARRDWKTAATLPPPEHSSPRTSATRQRETSIIGLYDDALRHADGSYTRAYHVELAASVFSDDLLLENRCNALARLLAARKPLGTVIQFRLTAAHDPGQALWAHAGARDTAHVHPLATILHNSGLQTYAGLAMAGSFRRTVLTCWVRVPNKGRQRTDDLFLATIRQEWKRQGFTGLPRAFLAGWQTATTQAIVRRTSEEERAAFAEAEKVFRLIEREDALRFTRFTRDELWAAVYLGHRQNATTVPTLPLNGVDICHYLCGETIEASGSYVLHGASPAAIVSLFTPPQPFITADALRLLSINGTLNFRHTIISEFLYPDQSKGIKRLDRRLRQVMRSGQSLSGKQKLAPEAEVTLQDLTAIRHDLAGGREALAQVRFYVVVYSEPAYTKVELSASLKQLDRYCEQVIAELRKINGADADREEPAALAALYPKTLVGEADAKVTGREITETASSLAPLIPTEAE